MVTPSDDTEAALRQARERFEAATGQTLKPDLEEEFADTAVDLLERRWRRPPRFEAVLDVASRALPAGPQIEFCLLGGLQGAFQRSWAALIMRATFAGDLGEEDDDTVEVIRAEFEGLLGRPLSSAGWDRLTRHAERHAREVVAPAMADCKQL